MNKNIISKITSVAILGTLVTYTVPVFAYTKDETVYSKISADGSNYSTIVSDHIKNDSQQELINDISDLLNIKNVNGDEKFTQNENELVWSANGSDIYYQGETQKELPIECKVKYELDGEEISAEDLAGKSGKVKITIEYVNKDEHIVKINGRNEKLYTPFVVVCGTILDNNTHKNIEITNGKLIDNGNKTVVIGMSMPGMQESLNISKSKIDIPNKVEITMDSTDFKLSNIVTYVTPKILEESDLEVFDKIDEIYSQINTLQSSSKQLVEGADTLEQGANTYSEKSKEFDVAMKQVSSGVKSANQNYSKIDDGIKSINENSSILQAGAKQISDGALSVKTNLQNVSAGIVQLQGGTKILQDGENKINSGIKQILASMGVETSQVSSTASVIGQINTLIETNKSAITNLENANKTLDAKINELKTNKETLKNQLASLESLPEESKTVIKELVNSQIASIDEQINTTIPAQKNGNNNLIKVLTANNSALNQILSSSDVKKLDELTTGLLQLQAGMDELINGTTSLLNGETELKAGVDEFANKTQVLVDGSNVLYQGTEKLADGTKVLSSGSKELKNGLNQLDVGAESLSIASTSLTDGANTLAQGATTLSEGMTTFDEEGIEKICNYINGDLNNIMTRLEKLQELSEEYKNFTMLNNEEQGDVKFIIIMDSIKKADENKQEAYIEEDKTKNN